MFFLLYLPIFTSLFLISDRSSCYGLVCPSFGIRSNHARTVPPPQTLDACSRCSVYGVEMLWRRRALFFTLHLTSLLASAGVRGSPRVVGWHRRLAAASGRLSLALPFLRALSIVTKLFPSFIPNPYVLLPARPSVRVTYPASLPYGVRYKCRCWRTILFPSLMAGNTHHNDNSSS